MVRLVAHKRRVQGGKALAQRAVSSGSHFDTGVSVTIKLLDGYFGSNTGTDNSGNSWMVRITRSVAVSKLPLAVEAACWCYDYRSCEGDVSGC